MLLTTACKQGGGTQPSFISATPNRPDYKPGLKDSPSQGSRLTHPPHTSVAVQGRDKHAGCLACSEPALLGSGFDQNVLAFVCMEVNSLVLSYATVGIPKLERSA